MSRLILSSILCLSLLACDSVPGYRPIGTGDPTSPPGPVGSSPTEYPSGPTTIPDVPPEKFELPPVQTSFETYELTIPQSAMELFEADVFTPEQPATFSYGGQSFPVSIRLRGASARTFPKKSWNVDFNDLRFQGREELNLVAEYQDSTMMVEKFAYDMLEAMKVPAPHAKYVRLMVNGKYQGLYVDIEEVDRKFVKARTLPDDDPVIYRCGGWDCEMKTWRGIWQGGWDKKSHKDEPSDDLDALLALINYTPEPEFPAKLEQNFELAQFLRFMAFEAIFANNFIEDARNYYLHDRITGRWYHVPWDLNNADPRFWPTYGIGMEAIYDQPLFSFTLNNAWLQRMYDRRRTEAQGYEPTFGNLRTRIVNNPALRRRLFPVVEKALNELLDPAVMIPRIEAQWAALAPHMQGDPYVDLAQFDYGRGFLIEFVNLRNDFVRQELARWKAVKPGLVIDRFDPAGGWIELKNRGSAPVSTSGLVLTTYLRRAVVPSNVPSRTLAPGESVRFTAGALGLSFAAKGEIGLFDGKTVNGVIDVLYYGQLPSGQIYARADDADASWQVR